MADYRDLSQQYAQGAIKAGILLNGGAAVALLSQTASLVSQGLAPQILEPMMVWTLGVFLGGFAWLFGFMSTRYVDKAQDEGRPSHLATANLNMFFGLAAVVLSLVSFMIGSCMLALGISRASEFTHLLGPAAWI